MLIAQNTSPTLVFLLVDADDAVSPVTGATPTVKLSKNGSAFAAAAGDIAEIGEGWYRVTLTPAETDTDGPLIIRAVATDSFEWRDIHQVYSDLTATLLDAVYDRVADHLLRRNFGAAAASPHGDAKGFRSLLGAVAKDVNRVELTGATLSIYEADDETVLGTQTVAANANPSQITGIDTDE